MTSAKGLNATGTDVVVAAMVTVAGVVVGVALVIISVVKVILIPHLHLVLIILVVKVILIPSDVFLLILLVEKKNILILLSLFTPHTITLAESTILTTIAAVAEVRREDADVRVENLLSSVFVPFLRERLLSIDCMPQKKVW